MIADAVTNKITRKTTETLLTENVKIWGENQVEHFVTIWRKPTNADLEDFDQVLKQFWKRAILTQTNAYECNWK